MDCILLHIERFSMMRVGVIAVAGLRALTASNEMKGMAKGAGQVGDPRGWTEMVGAGPMKRKFAGDYRRHEE